MGRKVYSLWPSYKLNRPVGTKDISFRFGGNTFVLDLPVFRVTETQKAVLLWMATYSYPPVYLISHETPRTTTGQQIVDPGNCQRVLIPYTQTVAVVDFLGGSQSEKFMVQFCSIWNKNDKPPAERRIMDKTVLVTKIS